MKTFIDLFAGVGGFAVALKKRGLQCVFASEIDPLAAQAYETNFGLKPHGDIYDIPADAIPPHDVLCAGFPCQPFSNAGHGRGLDDSRGDLFFEIIRIARHHKPEVILLENVEKILTIDNGAVKRMIYSMLDDIGYRLGHAMLNAGDFGVPQHRRRVYFVAIRKDSPLRFVVPLPVPMTEQRCVNDIIMSPAETAHLVLDKHKIIIEKPSHQPFFNGLKRVGRIGKGAQGQKIYSPSGHAPCQTVSKGRASGYFVMESDPQSKRIYHPNGHAATQCALGGGMGAKGGLYLFDGLVRKLHINEVKAVMGFDTSHFVSEGAHGYKQMGNAVVPAVVGHVFDGIG